MSVGWKQITTSTAAEMTALDRRLSFARKLSPAFYMNEEWLREAESARRRGDTSRCDLYLSLMGVTQ